MRLRKVKNALAKLKNNTKYFVEDPFLYKGRWQSLFSNTAPLHIEIGCGKGQFILELARRNPKINYIAIEKYDSVLLRAQEKLMEEDLPNVRLILLDAQRLEEAFAPREVEQIYINFSDPWPKKAHQKRRLTYKTFLASYASILKEKGAVIQKTDNRKLFEFSLESFSEENWVLSNISLNLHEDKDTDNIETEFEEKWKTLGPIYRLEARKR